MPIDYSKYPKNWLSEIRPRIMARANNKCEMCGLEHNQIIYSIKLYIRNNGYKYRSIWFSRKQDALRETLNNTIKQVKVILTIAHLDHDETNLNIKDNRLKAMCQICHLRYDAKEKYRRALTKE